MKIDISEVKKTKKKLTVSVDHEAVANAFKKIYAALNKKVQIKGFRKGKVPHDVLDKFYKEQVQFDTLNELVNTSYHQALHDHALFPLGQPNFDLGTLDKGKEFSYKVEIEIKPDFELKEYQGIPLKKKLAKVEDKDVQHELEHIQKSRAELKPVPEGTKLRPGLVTTIDFAGTINGEPFDGGTSKDYTCDFGEGHFLKDFEKQMADMQKGEERVINITFPKDYFQEKLRNQPAIFKVMLKALYEKELSQIDDELAKDLGLENLETLKKQCRTLLEKRQEGTIRNQYIDEIIKHLLAKNKIDIPENYLKGEMERTKKNKDEVTNSIKLQFIIEDIAKKEEIKLEAKDIEQRFQLLAHQYRKPIHEIKKHFQENHLLPQLAAQIISEKTLDLVLNKARID